MFDEPVADLERQLCQSTELHKVPISVMKLSALHSSSLRVRTWPTSSWRIWPLHPAGCPELDGLTVKRRFPGALDNSSHQDAPLESVSATRNRDEIPSGLIL